MSEASFLVASAMISDSSFYFWGSCRLKSEKVVLIFEYCYMSAFTTFVFGFSVWMVNF